MNNEQEEPQLQGHSGLLSVTFSGAAQMAKDKVLGIVHHAADALHHQNHGLNKLATVALAAASYRVGFNLLEGFGMFATAAAGRFVTAGSVNALHGSTVSYAAHVSDEAARRTKILAAGALVLTAIAGTEFAGHVSGHQDRLSYSGRYASPVADRGQTLPATASPRQG